MDRLGRIREDLDTLARLLRESGDYDRAIPLEDALVGGEPAIREFLVSNELWGGPGSIADEGGGAGRSEVRREIEQVLVRIGREQLRAGHVNARTDMWVRAFARARDAGI